MDAKYIKCAAKCCGNKLLHRSDLTFFTFPEDVDLAKIWARNSNITSYQYGSTLCSEHFEYKYFDNTFGKKSVFKQNVQPIPTIFNQKTTKQLESCTTGNTAKVLEIKDKPRLDFNDYCRLCADLKPASSLISLFDTSNNFSEQLEICLPGKVSMTDNLPHAICTSCAEKLKNCSLILQSFKDADKKFRSLNPTPSTSKQQLQQIAEEEEVIELSDGEDDIQHQPSEEVLEDSETEDVLDFLENVLEQTNKILEEIVPDDKKILEEIVPDDKTPKTKVKNIKEVKTKEVYKFKCIQCPSVFNTQEKIMLHAFHEHPENRHNQIISKIIKVTVCESAEKVVPSVKIYQCVVCNVNLNTKESALQHAKLNHKKSEGDVIRIIQPEVNLKHMCVNCPKVFDTKRDAQFHGYFTHPASKIVSKRILIMSRRSAPKVPTVVSETVDTTITYPYQSRSKEDLLPLETYHVMYQCVLCPEMYKTYKEVVDHYNEKHCESGGLVANVVKVADVGKEVIAVKDGTILEADPSVVEKRPEGKPGIPKSIPATRYKCLKCPKMLNTKKQIIQHNTKMHPNPGTKEIKCTVVSVLKQNSSYYTRNYYQRFECLLCCSHLATKYSLMQHMRLLHPEAYKHKFLYRLIEAKEIRTEPKQCLRCTILPLNYSRYRKHMRKHVSYNCEICDGKFAKINELREHFKEHNQVETENVVCIVCETEFPTRSEHQKHIKVHKEPLDVRCSNQKCNKRFNNVYELTKHVKKAHETCLCHECGKTYERPYIRQHLQTHNKDSPFQCKMVSCKKQFKTQSSLFRHQRNHVRKNDNTICQICGKIVTRSSLTLHMKIHSVIRSEVCDICGAGFYRKDHLRLHRQRHMQIERREAVPYECPQCNITLQNRKSYINHVSIIHGIEAPVRLKRSKNLSCVFCQKKFAYRCYLEEHYRIHKGERPYICQICKKSFATRIVLYQHKLTHLPYDQLRHQCDICNKKFRRQVQLADHKRVHTGEKPFPCPICKRPFRVRGEMVKHMRIHTKKEERVVRKKRPATVFEFADFTEETEDKKPRTINKIIRQNNTIYLIEEDDSNSLDYKTSGDEFVDDMPALE